MWRQSFWPVQGSLRRLKAEDESFWAALRWATEREDGEFGLRLGGALGGLVGFHRDLRSPMDHIGTPRVHRRSGVGSGWLSSPRLEPASVPRKVVWQR